MPMYEYKCENCGHHEDFLFSMSEEQPKKLKCPECEKKQMVRFWGYKVPIHFSAEFKEDNKINYDRSPSGRKRFF